MSSGYPGKDLEAMSFARNYHRWIRDCFRPHLGRRIAEVGSGTGSFTELLLETCPDSVTAFEPSDNLFPQLQERFAGDGRVDCVNSVFTHDPGDPPFQTICYVNVLEHIERDREELALARRALAPGGSLCLFVPALPWLYGEQDRRVGHWRRYRRGELIDAVTDAGFQVNLVRWFDLAGVLPWWINYGLLGRSVTPGTVSFYDRRVVPLMRRAENLVPPPIGKNLLLVARTRQICATNKLSARGLV